MRIDPIALPLMALQACHRVANWFVAMEGTANEESADQSPTQ